MKPHHPSLFLIAPYALYKILAFLGFSVQPDVAFIQAYQLVFTRLASTVLIYFLSKEVLSLFKIERRPKLIISVVLTFLWLFNPPVLYWTQNVYHEDQAHLTPSLALILYSIHRRFDFMTTKRAEMALQFLLALWVCSSSYYGWLLVPLVFMFSILMSLARKGFSMSSLILELRDQLLRQRFLYVGMISSIGLYFLQLYFLGSEYLLRPIERFMVRSSVVEAGGGGGGNVHSNLVIARRILNHISFYLPLSDDRNKLIVFAFSLLIGLLFAFWMVLGDFSHSKRESCIVLSFLGISPMLYVALLKNYSFIHPFSVLKVAFPLLLFSISLPLVVLESKFRVVTRLSNRPVFTTFSIVTISIVFLSQFIHPNLVDFAAPTHTYSRDLGTLVVNNIAEDELPLSENLFVGIQPPFTQYQTGRLVYKLFESRSDDTPRKYHSQSVQDLYTAAENGQANLANIQSMRPVYFDYSDNIGSGPVKQTCEGYWKELTEKVDGRRVSICRSPGLKELVASFIDT
jgi:hypothetical protein